MLFRSIMLLLFILTSSNLTIAQDANSVLEKYFSAIGGKSRIDSIHSIQIENLYIQYLGVSDTTFSRSTKKNPHFAITQNYHQQGKKLFSEFYTNGSGSLFRLYIPSPLDRKGESKPTELTIAHRLRTALLEKRIEYVGEDTVNEMHCSAIRVSARGRKDDVYNLYYFNKQSGLLTASNSEQRTDDLTLYLDYKNIDGFLFPFTQDYYLGNTLSTRTIFRSVVLNVEVDDKIFVPKAPKKQVREVSSQYNKIEYMDGAATAGSFQDFISHFKGKRVIIDLWATWCAPCKSEFNNYDNTFYAFLAEHKVEMVYLTIDDPEKTKAWKKDVDSYNLNGFHAMASKKLITSLKEEIYKSPHIFIPRYILVNEDGAILSDLLPEPSSADFQGRVIELLNSSKY